MSQKVITCTVCPMGCNITVTGEGDSIEKVEGYSCRRGEEYARNEFIHPVRILTTSVRMEGGSEPLMPVRSAKPVPKELLLDCVKILRTVTVSAPVKCGDTVVKNILGTGVDVIATGES